MSQQASHVFPKAATLYFRCTETKNVWLIAEDVDLDMCVWFLEFIISSSVFARRSPVLHKIVPKLSCVVPVICLFFPDKCLLKYLNYKQNFIYIFFWGGISHFFYCKCWVWAKLWTSTLVKVKPDKMRKMDIELLQVNIQTP